MTDHKSAFRISGKKRSVLLVEDEPINQEMMKAILADSYDVAVAGTGEEALSVLGASPDAFSIVLLDLNLPGMGGIDLLKRIKADPAFSRLPVIVMTADGDAEVECLTIGAIDFIPKPYPQPKVILARIRRTVELSEDRVILRGTERDQLTGLYNPEFFFLYANQLDQYYRDQPTDAVFLDVNRFHVINDRYGKEYGDRVLKKIAGRALEIAETSGGIVSRKEPDTFMIYCPHRSEYASLLEDLSASAGSGDAGDARIKLRMGVYSDVDKSLDVERRFDRAKMAADAVRENLAKPIGYYDHKMHEDEMLSEQLVDDFREAIREKQFAVYYQPKFDVRGDTPTLCSAEALVRWKHPTLGMVSPGRFIPLFEKNGLIGALDRYVWRETAAKIRDWKDRFGVSVPVSVNVSRVDFYDPELTERLIALVKENRLTCDDLLLEVTESAYTDNAEQIVEKVKDLRRVGFKIEMDDFGSGYSSLNMLSSMPVDALKLDMLFIRNAFIEKKGAQLLEVMIRLARSFELKTVAEGVETEEQMKTLKQMGCDVIQGYYFSRPLPADEFERFITEKASAAN